MKQSGHLNSSEETGTGKYGTTPPNKHGGVGKQQQCGVYVGAVEEMVCVVCVSVTEGA